MLGQRVSRGRDDRFDALRERLVKDRLTALKAAHDLGGEIVGGRPQPAAREDQVDLLGGRVLERALHVIRSVADDRQIGEIHPQLTQSLGEPRAVTVAHATVQHLGARHHYRGPHAHVQVGRCPSASVLRPALVIV